MNGGLEAAEAEIMRKLGGMVRGPLARFGECDLCNRPATGGDVLCDKHRAWLALAERRRNAVDRLAKLVTS